MRRWDGLLDRYMDEYVARGVAPATAANVGRELERFGSWLKRRRPRPRLEEVGSDLIVRYLQGRCAFRAKATLASVMTALRGMGELLVREGIWASNPLRWMKGPKIDPRARAPRRLSRSDMKKLWEAAASSRQGYHRHLWLSVLALLYGTGLRRGELERLNMGSWDGEQGLLRLDGRKTGRERTAALPELTWRCVDAYLPKRQNHLERLGRMDQPALLVNQFGERLSAQALSVGVQRLARRAGIEHLTLHQFRHSCASDLLEAGVRLPEVQRVLGHQRIGTTVRYLHIADPQRRAAVSLHPINQILRERGAA